MGCGGSVQARASKVSTVFVQVMPTTTTPVVQMEAEEESDQEEDQEGRELSDMMLEEAPSDHWFLKNPGLQGPPVAAKLSPAWMKRVAREWRMLSRGLPDAIQLRLYEDRMDLMRASIVGPQNTPYADALLFFDLILPPNYPTMPPSVTFWAYGKRLNPNLYANGKVCLSLLGTWSGTGLENWQPHKSNILQVLVSILGLVLVEEPFFNEPGYESSKGKPETSDLSRKYSEDVRLHVLRSMSTAPPAGFEELSKQHYAEHGPAILKRVEQLANGNGNPGETVTRVDGIDVQLGAGTTKETPSESFKKELTKQLLILREAWSLSAPESPVSNGPEALPMSSCGRKMGWMGRPGWGIVSSPKLGGC